MTSTMHAHIIEFVYLAMLTVAEVRGMSFSVPWIIVAFSFVIRRDFYAKGSGNNTSSGEASNIGRKIELCFKLCLVSSMKVQPNLGLTPQLSKLSLFAIPLSFGRFRDQNQTLSKFYIELLMLPFESSSGESA
uniref:Uncharacterized protein n=1 Tax=Glossina pallidipes TaxID=7398 RepID=A0A1B0AEK1_GLOPL